MKKYNTQAIVLKNIKYKDSDKIFTLFTKDNGKISAIGRGVRKISSKRAGNLDTLNLISTSIYSNSNGIKNIEEVKTLESFKNLKNNLKKSLKAYYLAELIYKTTEETEEDEQSAKIFNLFVRTLKALDKNGYEGDLFVCYFEMNYMNILGYQFTVDRCHSCGKPITESWNRYTFNIDNGGIECDKCSKFGLSLSKDAALSLESVMRGNLTKEMHDLVGEIDKVLKIYIGRKLESKFKSLEINME